MTTDSHPNQVQDLTKIIIKDTPVGVYPANGEGVAGFFSQAQDGGQ